MQAKDTDVSRKETQQVGVDSLENSCILQLCFIADKEQRMHSAQLRNMSLTQYVAGVFRRSAFNKATADE